VVEKEGVENATRGVITMTDPTYHFGICPECFREGRWDEEQHAVYVHRCIFATCKRHKTAWCVNWNALGSWTPEIHELWDENLRMLEQEYEPVESVHPQKM